MEDIIKSKRGRPRDPERMKRVMDSASQQFLEQGFDRASMEAVAQSSGVSKMTLYNYFPSKSLLLEACVGCRTDVMFEAFHESQLDPAQPKQGLTLIGQQFLTLMRAEDVIRMHRMLYGLATVHPEVCAGYFKAGPERVNALVQNFLAASVAAGHLHIDDISMACDQFLSLFQGRPHLRATLGLGAPDVQYDQRLVTENVLLFLARYGIKTDTC
ncbi:MAG: TetR/AcrR family transcriptional regulator [Pseudomonadota bacterium]